MFLYLFEFYFECLKMKNLTMKLGQPIINFYFNTLFVGNRWQMKYSLLDQGNKRDGTMSLFLFNFQDQLLKLSFIKKMTVLFLIAKPTHIKSLNLVFCTYSMAMTVFQHSHGRSTYQFHIHIEMQVFCLSVGEPVKLHDDADVWYKS